MHKLKDMKVHAWEYEQEVYNKLTDKDIRYSEMVEYERRFINGLIRYMKPKRILEVGVAEGGGSIVILNAINDIPESQLISIDLLENLYYDNNKKTGFTCIEKYENNNQWDLYTGKDPAELIEELAKGGKFDFAIIDTAHVHPIESLNFLSVLPYLSEDCIVVLHDIGLYAMSPRIKGVELYEKFPNCSFATKLLFDTMVGDKYILPVSEYKTGGTQHITVTDSVPSVFSNIGACQLNSDSRKYIGNVASMLNFPWGMFPNTIRAVLDFIQRHYSNDIYEQCLLATSANKKLSYNKNISYNGLKITPEYFGGKKIVFYGCGTYLKNIFEFHDWIFEALETEIWDKNADKIDVSLFERNGYIVKKPDFKINNKDGIIVIMTLDPRSEDIIEEVKQEIFDNGFNNVLLFDELDI